MLRAPPLDTRPGGECSLGGASRPSAPAVAIASGAATAALPSTGRCTRGSMPPPRRHRRDGAATSRREGGVVVEVAVAANLGCGRPGRPSRPPRRPQSRWLRPPLVSAAGKFAVAVNAEVAAAVGDGDDRGGGGGGGGGDGVGHSRARHPPPSVEPAAREGRPQVARVHPRRGGEGAATTLAGSGGCLWGPRQMRPRPRLRPRHVFAPAPGPGPRPVVALALEPVALAPAGVAGGGTDTAAATSRWGGRCHCRLSLPLPPVQHLRRRQWRSGGAMG